MQTNEGIKPDPWHGRPATGARRWRRALAGMLAIGVGVQPLLPVAAEAAITTGGNVFVGVNLLVGFNAAGSRTVDGAGVVDGPYTFINVGDEVGGDGTYVVRNGASATATGIGVGRRGIGRMTIASGATVSTTSAATGNINVGAEPGSDGTLTVTGAGTQVNVARQPIVGSAGDGRATIGDGAKLVAPRLLVGISATFGDTTSGATGSVAIRDPGTLVLLKGQSSFNSAGVLLNNVPVGFGGVGELSVLDGGTLDIAPDVDNHRGGVSIGGVNLGLPGDGTMTVSGPGSTVRVRGNSVPGSTIGATFTLGESDASGTMVTPGVLNVLNGGTVLVEGTPAAPGGAFARAGRFAGGTGEILVSGTGSRMSVAGLFVVGQKNAGDPAAAGHGTGDVTVTAGGRFDALRLNVGDGAMSVSGGGRLSTATGRTGDLAGQVGSLTVSGTNSIWTLDQAPMAPDARNFFLAGATGTGTLNVVNGGQVIVGTANRLGPAGLIGRFPGSVGTVNISGPGSRIELIGKSDPTIIEQGSNPQRTMGSGFNVGDQGTGTLNVTAGGKLVMRATNVSTGLPENSVSIGRFPGVSGTAVVSGAGSEIIAQTVRIGLDPADVPAGTGVLTVAEGGRVTAGGNIKIGPRGVLNGGGGTIVGNIVNLGGIVNPGQSPGRLSIVGDYESVGGTLVIEVDANGNHDVLAVAGKATFDAASAIEIKIDPSFHPTTATTFDVVQTTAADGGSPRSLLTVRIPAGGGTATTTGALSRLPTEVSVEPVASAALSVGVDVQPGRSPNVLNAASEGPLPVAILGTAALVARDIDPSTITLTSPALGLSAAASAARCQIADVDGDRIPDLLCYLDRNGDEIPGDAVATLRAETRQGIAIEGSDQLTVVDQALQLGALRPAKIWVGLKNSDDIGLRIDLQAEVYLGADKVASGQVTNAPAGGSGFNNASLHTIPLTLSGGPIAFDGGTPLKLVVSARRTCATAVGHSGGTLRLWYNGPAVDSGARRDAGSRLGATIDDTAVDYFLRPALLLSPLAGSSRQAIDRAVDSRQACSVRAFTSIGTWVITP